MKKIVFWTGFFLLHFFLQRVLWISLFWCFLHCFILCIAIFCFCPMLFWWCFFPALRRMWVTNCPNELHLTPYSWTALWIFHQLSLMFHFQFWITCSSHQKSFPYFHIHYGCGSIVQKQNNVLIPKQFIHCHDYDVLNDEGIECSDCKLFFHYVNFLLVFEKHSCKI